MEAGASFHPIRQLQEGTFTDITIIAFKVTFTIRMGCAEALHGASGVEQMSVSKSKKICTIYLVKGMVHPLVFVYTLPHSVFTSAKQA